MDTVSPLASLEGLSLDQIAALDTTEEILERIVPKVVPVAAFNSAI
jgi:hypothetical protein